MQVHPVQLPSGNAHGYDVGGNGPLLHFYHANGFPFCSYTEFVTELTHDFHVIGLAHRATWKNIGLPSRATGWMSYADDLFSALVLIEPIFFPTPFLLAARSVPFPARRLFPIIRKTLERRERWSSVQEFVEFHRGKRAFSRFTETSLEHYGAHGLTPDGQGALRLTFPRAWEAHVFSTPPYPWRWLKALTVPALGVRAELSDFVPKASWQKWRRLRPQDHFAVLSGVGHMAPLEAPHKTARVVTDWLHSRKAEN